MNRKKVRRIVRLNGWQVWRKPQGKRPRAQGWTSRATRANERWAVDTTHIFCGRDGWCHLTAIIDCCDRTIVGWRLSRSGVAKVAAAALADVLRSRGIVAKANELTLRSDNGLVFGAKPFKLTFCTIDRNYYGCNLFQVAMNQKFPISACIITFNEESRIRDCLESVKWVDEIIVVDSLSSDKTVDICREYTNQVYQRAWPGNIDQKNYTIGLAKSDWILSLDADERLSSELIEEIQDAIRNPGDVLGFFFPRRSFHLGRWICHGEWYPDYQLQLFKRGFGQWQGTNPHGRVVVQGKTRYMKHDLYHFNYKNFAHQLRTMDTYSTIFADVTADRGKGFGLFKLLFQPLYKFIRGYFFKRGFLDGLPGFVIATASAFYIFVKQVKLWERLRNHEIKKGNDEVKR